MSIVFQFFSFVNVIDIYLYLTMYRENQDSSGLQLWNADVQPNTLKRKSSLHINIFIK